MGVGGTAVPSSLTRLFIWEPERPFLQLLLNVLHRPSHPHSGRWGRNNRRTARCPVRPSRLGPVLHLAFGGRLEEKDQEDARLVPSGPVRCTNPGARTPGFTVWFRLLLCDTPRQENALKPLKRLPSLLLHMGKLRLREVNTGRKRTS